MINAAMKRRIVTTHYPPPSFHTSFRVLPCRALIRVLYIHRCGRRRRAVPRLTLLEP
ncbi:hypothetical protein E2C01_099611 [Portunus trituberculatus]|uniref:Uncharacterized protein n=1 Tax=Portunus trituberculatus TaxID=210409 RepID=A0A5B7KA37_PORTR|nr:hypothetical protein [Portunus trituberculatus]